MREPRFFDGIREVWGFKILLGLLAVSIVGIVGSLIISAAVALISAFGSLSILIILGVILALGIALIIGHFFFEHMG